MGLFFSPGQFDNDLLLVFLLTFKPHMYEFINQTSRRPFVSHGNIYL